jgi:branched-chain amino acid transport system substrate-binding protein
MMSNKYTQERNGGGKAVGRRELLQGAAAATLGATLDIPFVRRAGAEGAPVKIGVLAPLSGVFSSLGSHKVEGIKLFFADVQMKAGGRPVQLIIEDDEGKPQEGLRQARKLVESDQVDLLLGVLSSAVGTAVKDYVGRAKKVWVTTGAAADGIFKKKNKNPYAFRSSLSTWQGNNPMGTWLASQKVKRVLLTGPDYSMGHEAVDAFRGSFEAAGPKIETSIFAPLGTSDFAPYLAEIKRKEPEVVYASYAGSDAVRFVQQYAAFGLSNTIPLTGYGYISEEDVIEAAGIASKGIRSGLNWAYGIDTAENKEFVARYLKAYKAVPTVDSVAGYVGAQVVHAAIERLNGDVSSQDRLSEAVGKVRINTPRGPISFDPDTNNVIQTIYVREVADIGGSLHNRVLATYPDVRDPGD